jgi:hypothetical protein
MRLAFGQHVGEVGFYTVMLACLLACLLAELLIHLLLYGMLLPQLWEKKGEV